MQLSGHVAIVDDDASIRVALSRLLRAHGINSQNYPSAHVFLDTLSSTQHTDMPDCLIVDVNMPGMSGIELQREILNCGVRVPTIVITGYYDKGVATSAASLGATAFFLKPAPLDALLAAIASAQKRHMRDDLGHSGIVVEWLDACSSGQLKALLDLHEERATLICDCDGINLVDHNSIATYWKSKLDSKATSAFTLNGMILTGDEIRVDCQGCKGKPVRVHLRLSPLGKIRYTRFSPLPCAA